MAVVDVVVRSAFVAAAVAVVLLAFLYVTQRSMLYFPGPSIPAAELLPARAETVELETDDGLRLGAWFLPAADAGADRVAPVPGPAILICNGNAGDRSHRLPLAIELSERGYAVLLFDYRGYAGNPGTPTEDGLRADARAALEALVARPEVDAKRIAYFGESLGAAVAGGLASERPPAALVLRSPPPSIAEMGRHHYPYLPIVDALLLDRYPLREQASELEVPLLVLVTQRDEIVPAVLSRRVYDAAAGPKRYVALSAAHHNDPALLIGDELLAELSAFLDEWIDGASR